MASSHLRILTLNAWSIPIPLFCKERPKRVDAICQHLAEANYDIISLQEIWSKDDYKKICVAVKSVLPYTHYFYSGMIGSGVCILSKHPILQSFHHRFQLNGYSHKVHHGDWFGGKVIGLCRVQVKNLVINVYSAHLHAKYHDTCDEYNAHRLSQACQLSQFVKLTSEGCDAVLLMGDFNFEPKDLGYQIIVANANVTDSWTIESSSGTLHEMTCDRPDNCFTTKTTEDPHGQCLDYIFFRNNAGVELRCEERKLAMQKIGDSDMNYSDHEGVEATFILRQNVTAAAKPRDIKAIEVHLTEALAVFNDGMISIRATRVFYIVLLTLSLMLFIGIALTPLPFTFQALLQMVLTIVMCYSLWYTVVLSANEYNALMSTKLDMNNVLANNPAM